MIMRILIVYLVNFVQDFTNFTEIQFLWADDSDIHSIIHTIHDDHSAQFVRIQTGTMYIRIIRGSNNHLQVRPGPENWNRDFRINCCTFDVISKYFMNKNYCLLYCIGIPYTRTVPLISKMTTEISSPRFQTQGMER